MALTALKTFLAKIMALALGVFGIRFDFDKAAAHPVGFGYDRRPDVPLTGILIHSTSGKKGSRFKDECIYLRDAPAKSTHYEIGKDGVIQRLLDPGPWRAWHAGKSSWRGRAECNDYMVGVELHHADGEEYTDVQLAALAWLCKQLMADHPTITVDGVALHRWVALPEGRKSDPTDLDDDFWREWIAELVDEFPIEGKPSITREVFAAQLVRRNSPALAEHYGGWYFDLIAGYGLDPAIALAFFGKESEFGTYEHSPVDRLAMVGAKNWGNLRPLDGDPNHWPGGRAGRRVDSKRYGFFRGYERWEDGLRDWCEKMLSAQYRGKSLLNVLSLYAPAKDGNNPVSYAATVKEWVADWRAQSAADEVKVA